MIRSNCLTAATAVLLLTIAVAGTTGLLSSSVLAAPPGSESPAPAPGARTPATLPAPAPAQTPVAAVPATPVQPAAPVPATAAQPVTAAPATLPAADATPGTSTTADALAPATAAPAPEPAVPGVETSTQMVSNPYGLDALWAQGDWVARGTLVILALMSMATWSILLTKIFGQSRLMSQARQAGRKFWAEGSVKAGIETLAENNPFRYVAEVGLRARDHHEGTLVENIDMHTWVTVSIQHAVERVVGQLQSGLATLATVGSTAPFVGLFGTVWGIYHALVAIGIAGQASIDKVAGPVGEALIMTAIGLAVAVPAVLGYNALVRRNKLIIERVRSFGVELHGVLLSGINVTSLVRPAARGDIAKAA
jgi:biopolymer transport protein ExbB